MSEKYPKNIQKTSKKHPKNIQKHQNQKTSKKHQINIQKTSKNIRKTYVQKTSEIESWDLFGKFITFRIQFKNYLRCPYYQYLFRTCLEQKYFHMKRYILML